MAYPQEARISCNECNGWYSSESELYEHILTVHRRCAAQELPLQHTYASSVSLKNQVGSPKEEWAKLSIQLRNRIRLRFNSEELEIIDRFILLASQGSVFDDAHLQPQLAKAV
jgi:hypothetical protein